MERPGGGGADKSDALKHEAGKKRPAERESRAGKATKERKNKKTNLFARGEGRVRTSKGKMRPAARSTQPHGAPLNA